VSVEMHHQRQICLQSFIRGQFQVYGNFYAFNNSSKVSSTGIISCIYWCLHRIRDDFQDFFISSRLQTDATSGLPVNVYVLVQCHLNRSRSSLLPAPANISRLFHDRIIAAFFWISQMLQYFGPPVSCI